MLKPRSLAKRLRGPHAKIFGTCGKIGMIAGETDPPAGVMHHLDLIEKRDRGHQRLDLMESVGTFPENAERKVDLGRSGECDGIHSSIIV